jgi:hypothetical protein
MGCTSTRAFDPLNLNCWRQNEEIIPVKLFIIFRVANYIETQFFYIYFPHLNEMFYIFLARRIELNYDENYKICGSTFLQNGKISINYNMPDSILLYTKTLKFTSIIPIKIQDENVQSILNYFYFVLICI